MNGRSQRAATTVSGSQSGNQSAISRPAAPHAQRLSEKIAIGSHSQSDHSQTSSLATRRSVGRPHRIPIAHIASRAQFGRRRGVPNRSVRLTWRETLSSRTITSARAVERPNTVLRLRSGSSSSASVSPSSVARCARYGFCAAHTRVRRRCSGDDGRRTLARRTTGWAPPNAACGACARADGA